MYKYKKENKTIDYLKTILKNTIVKKFWESIGKN